MEKKYIIDNISIARDYMNRFSLLLSDDKILFDCCYLPPFKWKAFYAQFYKKTDSYYANCAYTYYSDINNINSYSVSFSSIEEYNKHPAKKGDIICKIVPLRQEYVLNLISLISEYVVEDSDDSLKGIILDGDYLKIRIFKNGSLLRDIDIDYGEKSIIKEAFAEFTLKYLNNTVE
ncbi:MAG: hypothetical protein J6X60_12005 [Ruminiclostridium sp.]|nr:hypothetical protein [Ruminiclostridium sp.]